MSKNELVDFQENEIIEMLDDTSKIVADDKINNLSAAAVAAQGSNTLANNVEFWK